MIIITFLKDMHGRLGGFSFVWRGVGGKLKDFRAFLDAIASNKSDGALDYAH